MSTQATCGGRLGSWLGGLAIGASSLTASCGATCDRNPDIAPLHYTDGITDLTRGTYESAPLAGPFLDFKKGHTIEFVHGLGRVPDDFHIFLSFDKCPLPKACEPGDQVSSNFTEGVGNQALVEDVNDKEIVVRNDTCSDIRIRVTAVVYRGATTDAGVP